MSRLTIVIPCRDGKPPIETLMTLQKQTWNNFTIVMQPDFERRGANWARNKGFSNVNSELVLFSDDDIQWNPRALEWLVKALDDNPAASYSYGSYNHIGTQAIECDREFNPELLRKINFISTMSLIRTAHFPLFDEELKRLQDYELWIRMYKMGYVGVYCNRMIFRTKTTQDGVTYGTISYQDAMAAIRAKHPGFLL